MPLFLSATIKEAKDLEKTTKICRKTTGDMDEK